MKNTQVTGCMVARYALTFVLGEGGSKLLSIIILIRTGFDKEFCVLVNSVKGGNTWRLDP